MLGSLKGLLVKCQASIALTGDSDLSLPILKMDLSKPILIVIHRELRSLIQTSWFLCWAPDHNNPFPSMEYPLDLWGYKLHCPWLSMGVMGVVVEHTWQARSAREGCINSLGISPAAFPSLLFLPYLCIL